MVRPGHPFPNSGPGTRLTGTMTTSNLEVT